MAPAEPRARAYDSSGRKAAALRSRGAVLDACRELLFQDGYRAATIRAVAERAGVSPETVHKTFGGKPGLLKALWDVTLAGDDEPAAMAERPQLQEVFRTRDPGEKLGLYAEFVCGVHERTGRLFALLTRAGPEVADFLDATEAERLTGVRGFVAHLAREELLRPGEDQERAADVCWVLTSPQVFGRLTEDRGWDTAAYRDWLAGALAAALV
ncbi:transcriptional regulator [Streptomyces sp. AcH 505]|uniref:TetR/AcrR family transcriptional regulator n=1 Tax=Streptomyces sp. AcH 505 TaxID=352211 RepID=UPI000591EC2E|nr:transcriptional regulator [Streptomyces sp. AcH 505]